MLNISRHFYQIAGSLSEKYHLAFAKYYFLESFQQLAERYRTLHRICANIVPLCQERKKLKKRQTN